MKTPSKKTYVVASLATLLLIASVAQAKKQPVKDGPITIPTAASGSQKIQITLKDGSVVSADSAWDSAQGIWYQRGGMTNLIARDRIKKIGLGDSADGDSKAPEPQTPEVDESPVTVANQPVWIYLVGGAKVEADSATESTAGVWYRRGSLSIFIDRVRVDHIEREPLESLAESNSSSKKERGWTTGSSRIDSLIRQNGAKHGVDPYLIFCVMEQESHFNPRALSPKGARGLMQLMPGTAARFGVRRASDPAQNISGGTRYLKQLIGQFNGRIDLVLASYNAGEGAVLKFGRRVPPYRETRAYVKRIGYRYRKTKHADPAPVSAKETRGIVAAGT